jgi:hypothetical protein
MAKIPTSTQTSLWQRLTSHAEQRWPQISRINTRYRAGFAYIDAVVDGETLRLCRLRYGGSAHQWGFAIYRASHDDYEDSYLPTGYPVGTCEEALDTACGLYSVTPPPGSHPRRTNGRDHTASAPAGSPCLPAWPSRATSPAMPRTQQPVN